eukprot:jgi/Bigna1/141701/aug1.64_g16409
MLGIMLLLGFHGWNVPPASPVEPEISLIRVCKGDSVIRCSGVGILRYLLYGALGISFASAFAYLYLGYLDERKRALEKTSRYMKNLRRRRKRLGINSNKSLERPECVICFANKREIAFAPCGHFMACETCSQKVKKCPYCSKHIRTRLKIYTV